MKETEYGVSNWNSVGTIMKQTLQSISNILLLVLWDCVFGNTGYLLLRPSHHVALSSHPVYVDFQLTDNNTVTARNLSILLLDISSNQTVTSKEVDFNKTHGTLEFECFHFITAGLYQFQMNVETGNNSIVWRSSTLNITWPVFHFDLDKTSREIVSSFQIGVFTNIELCPTFPGLDPTMDVEVEHIHSLQELEELSHDSFMVYKTLKQIPLVMSQWVELECASERPEPFIKVSLKSIPFNSVITSIGPIDLVKTFNYKLVITPNQEKCDTSVNINIITPPCNYAHGKIVVFNEAQRSLGESVASLAEYVLQKGENSAHFNCTLFDIGKNKYCFELLMNSINNYSLPRVKECMDIRREIEAWSLWQSWSPCSSTCGDGRRERHRECLTMSPGKPSCIGSQTEISPCSLEDCSTVKPSSKSTTQTENDNKTTNTVTITGISLCLFIIIITIVITVWRKLSKATCSANVRHSSSHSINCRKNSDEENIYQFRESFSDAGDGVQEIAEESVQIPLTCRQSLQVAEEPAITENDSSNVQKIIPPIFSYRLAQQQLKEMKQKGLTETTKLYHVSQNPMTDTVVDVSSTPPLSTEKSEENTPNKFRIQSPFLEHKIIHGQNSGERLNQRSTLPTKQAMSPSQTMPRLSHIKNQESKPRHFDRAYQKNNFRRTSSFHETKHHKPHRERSLSTLSPRQSMTYNTRTRTWESAAVERSKHKSKSPENVSRGANLRVEHCTKHQYTRPVDGKPDVTSSRYPAAKASKAEKPEQNKMKKGPSPIEKSWNRAQDISSSPKDGYQRSSALIPSQYRREKCQSFPWGTEYSFYDNTTFGLTEAEQRMIDLPGYFASNEEDETSTLSVERLVI
ncbi:thrombospondin type-1 domain-containing protein 1 [Discoglossus pictus]